jgi:phosphohistidine phosphatase
MPRLLLLRHAKAERARAGETDHERVLSERGIDDAAAMGKIVAERGDTPDLLLCSTSTRTRQTWNEVRSGLGALPEERFLRPIYEADDYARILQEEGGAAQSILLIGHNPAMQATAATLAADLAGRDGRRLSAEFPTAALAVLDFDGEWRTLKPRRMRLVAFVAPPGPRSD